MPQNRYLTYLLAVLGCNEDQVRRVMEIDHMVLPTDAEIAEVRFGLDLPGVFRPFDERHRDSIMWLGSRGILVLSRSERSVVNAFELLRGPARDIVEVLITGGWSHASVAGFVNERKLGECGEEDIFRFQSMFWSVTELQLKQLLDFFSRHPSGNVLVDVLDGGPGRAREVAEVLAHRLCRHRELHPQVHVDLPTGRGPM
jgi:hypothetical protein